MVGEIDDGAGVRAPRLAVDRRADSYPARSGTVLRVMQLYLDCDGVLADFDTGAARILGAPPRVFEKRHGLLEFWRRLARDPDFYATLPMMPDAMTLFDAVRHLDPIILTGVPRGQWATPQKVRWAAEHFPGTRIITCLAADKRRHARDGDILVDDTLRYRELWEKAGGIFRPPSRCRDDDRRTPRACAIGDARALGRASVTVYR